MARQTVAGPPSTLPFVKEYKQKSNVEEIANASGAARGGLAGPVDP